MKSSKVCVAANIVENMTW